MKSVLISIQPKWVEKIASGEKTIEVRKTRPTIGTPFKCYIYCTKENKHYDLYINEPKAREKYGYISCLRAGQEEVIKTIGGYKTFIAHGKVIGEFVCDKIVEHESEFWDDETYESIGYIDYDEEYGEREKYIFAENGEENALCKHSCLTWNELREYVGQDIKTFYGWHITDLKIYDKPKELCEFRKPCKFAYSSYEEGTCYEDCIQGKLEDCRCFCLPIRIPFQSWGYIEDIDLGE